MTEVIRVTDEEIDCIVKALRLYCQDARADHRGNLARLLIERLTVGAVADGPWLIRHPW